MLMKWILNDRYQEGGGNLPALKESGIATFGSLPILVHEGKKYAQGCNIAVFVASKGGFAGDTDEEKADVPQFVLAAEDARGPIWSTVFGKTTKEEFLVANDRWFSSFERHITGKEYFVLDKFTIADLAIYEIVNTSVKKLEAPIDTYPNLKAHWERIGSRPKIAAYEAAKKA